MRISKKYLYPIITAILFPIVLTGLMWTLDGLSDESWYRGQNVEIGAERAVTIARTSCFSRDPADFSKGSLHTYLKGDVWQILVNRKGRYWVLPGVEKIAFAEVNARTGWLTHCMFDGWNTRGPRW